MTFGVSINTGNGVPVNTLGEYFLNSIGFYLYLMKLKHASKI